MMKHEYQNLMNGIRVPEELNEKVLAAAKQTAPARKVRRQPVWRVAVCAGLAVVLAAGSISLRPAKQGGETEQTESCEVLELPELTCSFGLTAYAADTIPAANGNLLLGGRTTDGTVITTTELKPERDQFTNYRFQISGENIEGLTLSMDRGGLYRGRNGQNLMEVLQLPAEQEYDPDVVYGLWVPPAELMRGRGKELLNGALLTVTARFADGSEQTNSYRLTAQQLQISRNEDGTELLVPALEGSDRTGVSGMYLESLSSVWFQWPVEGANTISLSNRYGFRAAPGGQGGTFHAGIDIPAESGTPILAAAGGTVTEAGYDTTRGNYLVVDHGGGMETVYGQCLRLDAEAGDAVTAGQVIAAVGSTGLSTGPHLHFEVRQEGEAQNPVAYFDAETRETLKMG